MKASGAVAKVLTLACLLQVTTARREFNDLRVRTNAFGLPKSEAFYEIPTLSSSPLFRDYIKAKPEPGFKFQMDFYCPQGDPRVCFMYDKKGNVAGVQISFLKDDVANIHPEHYDYSKNPNYVQTNFFNKPAYSTRVYFTNPEKLTLDGRQDPSETAEGLWAYLDGKLVEIPRKQPTGPKMGDFDRQGCYPAMGQHYVYKYNKDSSCKDLYVLFFLYDKGELVGLGIAAPGTGSKGLHREWYETPTGDVMKVVTPNPPSCKDLNNYEHKTVHVFLVNHPWDIGCP